MAEYAYAELHAFPDGGRPHTGNPAGVMVLDAPLSDADMLGVAQSNNLSETAFLIARPGEADAWDLRWFTPATEVDLCGHATLASGAWLFETGRVKGDQARFETRSGPLTVDRADAGYAMDFPAVAFQPGEAAPGVVQAMGAPPESVFEVERIHGDRYQMLVYSSEAAVAGLAPDSGALAKTGVNVLATAAGTSADVVSRFFCPAAGIVEDPVTGSAHCTLAPFWADRLGRRGLTARQIGPRPGALSIEARPGGRVGLTGTARLHLEGTLFL